jgi:hypothetical protein
MMKNMSIRSNKDNRKIWQCECKQTLGFLVDDHIAVLKGMNGQEYEINFNSIKLTCDKCGKDHFKQPSATQVEKMAKAKTREELEKMIMDKYFSSGENKSDFYLGKHYRDMLLKKLSQKQKEIYKLLLHVDQKNIPFNNIAKETGLSLDIVKKHIKVIQDEYDGLVLMRDWRNANDRM